MAKKLQEKEFFIPLSGGTQTEGDPRLPQGPTIITENADFSIPNVVRKREPLTTLFGSGDTESQLASGITSIAPSSDGRTVIAFGRGTYESTGVGSFEQTSNTNPVTGSALISTKATDEINSNGFTWADANCIVAANTASGLIYMRLSSGVVSVIDDQSGTITSAGNAADILQYDNTVISITQSGGNWLINSYDGSSWTNVSAAHSVTLSGLVAEKWDTNIIAVAGYTNSGNNVDAVFLNSVSGVELASTTNNLTQAYTSPRQRSLSKVGDNRMVFTSTNAGFYRAGRYLFYYDNASTVTFLSQDSVTNSTLVWASGASVNSTHHVTLYTYKNASTNGTFITNQRLSDVTTNSLSAPNTGTIFVGLRPSTDLYEVESNVHVVMCDIPAGTGYTTATSDVDQWRGRHSKVLARIAYDPSGFREVSSIMCQYGDFGRSFDAEKAWENLQQFHSKVTPVTVDGRSLLICHQMEPLDNGHMRSTTAKIDITARPLVPRQLHGYTVMPGGAPCAYDGEFARPLGPPEYPLSVSAFTANSATDYFTAAGGLGTYQYATTYFAKDRLGNESESSPSLYSSVAVANVQANVITRVLRPNLFLLRSGIERAGVRIYRSDVDGAYLYEVNSNAYTSQAESEESLNQRAAKYGSNTSIGEKVFVNRALYTMNGDLPAEAAGQHFASCIHKGRYTYAEYGTNTIFYSKAPVPGVALEFNSVLQLDTGGDGGEIGALESRNDKLYIFRDRALMATYGEPLNNAGAGSGYADPRTISYEYGAKDQRSVYRSKGGIFFINSVDGLIYFLDGNDNIQYVGGPVRHYCEQYEYQTCWANPRESSVRFASETVGAPTLSYNYKYDRWSTFDGRYANGIKYAFAAPCGSTYGNGNKVLDVLLDVNSNTYVQDPSGIYGTTESYDLKVSTSWIPLNDVAGYGKFYKWTLVGGKPSANCNIIARTAYAYEPYWSDNVEVNITTNITTSELSDHFGTMTDSTVVDKSFKYEFDGSRHKTDSVRIQIETNNGTERDNIELIGIRCRVGVKQGAYRVGDGRSTS